MGKISYPNSNSFGKSFLRIFCSVAVILSFLFSVGALLLVKDLMDQNLRREEIKLQYKDKFRQKPKAWPKYWFI